MCNSEWCETSAVFRMKKHVTALRVRIVCVCVICVSSWLLKMKYINYLLFSVRERDSNIKQNESASQRSSYSCAEYSGKRRMHRGIERTIRCDEHVNWRTSLSDCIHCVYNMCVRACECVCELLRVFLPFLRMHFYDITERCAHDVHGQLKRVNQNRMHARTTYVRAFAKKNHTDTHTQTHTRDMGKVPCRDCFNCSYKSSRFVLSSFLHLFHIFFVLLLVGAHLSSPDKPKQYERNTRRMHFVRLNRKETVKKEHPAIPDSIWTLQWVAQPQTHTIFTSTMPK